MTISAFTHSPLFSGRIMRPLGHRGPAPRVAEWRHYLRLLKRAAMIGAEIAAGAVVLPWQLYRAWRTTREIDRWDDQEFS